MSPRDLRREAMRCLRDLDPNVALASELLARAEQEDEHERQLRRAHRVELEPELWSGCHCKGAQ